MNIFFILAVLCGLGALGTIFVGVTTMGRDGTVEKAKGNKLMQWRIRLQVAAIVFLLLAAAA